MLSLKYGKQPFFAVLKHCIDEHPLLSTVILGADTESPEFATPMTLNLDAHIEIRGFPDEPEQNEDSFLEDLLAQLSDELFGSLHTSPPWKIVLVSLPPGRDFGPRLLTLFTNYHSHGDGRSGLAFQESFHTGLSKYCAQGNEHFNSFEAICKAPTSALLPPIEDGGKLTLSWSYLLSPLLGTYLPKSVASILGLRDSWLSQEADIWRGKNTQYSFTNHSTGLVLLTVKPRTMSTILQHCRANKTTFTGLLVHLIAESLKASEGGAVTAQCFKAGVAIDMRGLYDGLYSKSMLNCVTGYSELVHCSELQEDGNWTTNPSSRLWEAACKTTARLRVAASTLHNQPIGLLQYLKAFRPWTAGLIGKERDMSFEISNLGAFRPGAQNKETISDIAIESLIFSQPAKASGSLLDFNPVSVEGGSLAMTVTWQLGVLNLPEEIEETAFVRSVCATLNSSLYKIAASL